MLRNVTLALLCLFAIFSAPRVLAQFTVNTGQRVPVTISTATDFNLNGGILAPTDVTLSGKIDVQSPSAVIRPQNPVVFNPRQGSYETSLGPTTLSGPIVGAGNILGIGNESIDQLIVSGDNSYSGLTLLFSGEIIAASPTAFGSAAGATTVQGAHVLVQAATDERFRLERGSLRFDAGDFVPSEAVEIASGDLYLPSRGLYETPIVLDGEGGSVHFVNSASSSWTGGVTGTGNLLLSGRLSVDAPLTHDGDLTLDGPQLNAVNTYTGKTVFTDEYVIDRADVFGVATSPLEVISGEVTVEVLPSGDRGFTVRRGILDVQTTDPISAPITLGGDFDASLRGVGVYNGPLDYVTTSGGGYARILGGTFNGTIRGDTLLWVGGEEGVVTLNASNDIQSLVSVSAGTVVVNHAEGLPLAATIVQGGLVELKNPVDVMPVMKHYPYAEQQTGTLRLSADQRLGVSPFVGRGTLESNAEVHIDRIVSLGANLTSTEQGSLIVDGEILTMGSSNLAGKLGGTGVVRVAGDYLRVDADLSEFTGDLVIDEGILALSNASTMNGATDIYVQRGATLRLQDDEATITSDIYLNNANGHDSHHFFRDERDAALIGGNYASSLTLAGRLDVGEEGSTIAGDLRLEGPITGSRLTVRGGRVTLASPVSGLTEQLRVVGGLTMADTGALSGLDEVLLEAGASLYMSQSANTDRIDDETLLRSLGGQVSLISDSNHVAHERFGTLLLEAGVTTLVASSDHGGSLPTNLSIGDLQRRRGATLRFNEAGRQTTTRLEGNSTFDGEMIGGWATYDNATSIETFAAVDSSGRVVALSPTTSSLNSAGPDDHVSTQGSVMLASDRVVASLDGSPYSLDLNGHQLTVRSGGIYRGNEIQNGRLTAGDGGPAELFLHRVNRVDADIVDNGENGAVSLVLAGYQYTTTLTGHNTYSGGTWVVGDSSRATLAVEGTDAIPESDTVYVDFGQYEARLDAPGVVELSALHVRSDGRVSGVNATYDAREYFLEDGDIYAPIAGDGTIFKEGRGAFYIQVESPEYTGQVTVLDGVLDLGEDNLPNATIHAQGGRLIGGGQYSRLSSPIVLDGGELQGNFGGPVQVASDSSLYHDTVNSHLAGELSGSADLTVRGARDNDYVKIAGDASAFSGDLVVVSGGLRIAASASLGDGVIHVQEGASLFLGADRASDGQTILGRDVRIQRGELYAVRPGRDFGSGSDYDPNSVVTGDVYVDDFAILGANGLSTIDDQPAPGLIFEGRLVLGDHAQVTSRTHYNAFFFVSEAPLVEVAGQLDVGADNVWRTELAKLKVSGSIRAHAADSAIDFHGLAAMIDFSEAELIVESGRSLSITVNGQSLPMEFDSAEARLAGGGSFQGDFALSGGATIAPGASPGELTIDGDLELGVGAVYEWELDDPAAGPGVGWDFLDIEGVLSCNAAPGSPWVFEIAGFGGAVGLREGEWIIATAEAIEGFDPASVVVSLGLSSATSSGPAVERFSVEQRGDDLYLVMAVPEPASVVGLLSLCLAIVPSRRARSASRAE
ncbi:hypothetical protein Mal64_27280 [Pseudobythopirellula maris]|uniref:Autotransporter-associated beta strand repeat protein n=1 Tax=Pseudobythopirellula maris TaxID=2527991 RepID=A0A5C5ZJ55_9BACT|nr:hypothetical protein [Pseudobythopirellula maris]TWT87190.1 hypothetical protein Mal64_27280 [Pseudobythopirellula maris]